MFDPNSPVISLAAYRLHIRQLYQAGELSPEVATVRLLRVDIDEIARARRARSQAEPPPDYLPRGDGGFAA
jgi:hypothetical protein